MNNQKRKVVVMGGGTGTFPVVSALKALAADISCVIAVSDSGGSTGRIRDEFGFQPVGDLRQSLAALAEDEGQLWIRKILLYRFAKGTGLKGHNLGNLILTALQDMTGSTREALEIAEKIFRLEGRVIPITDTTVDLQITYTDGTSVVGEHILDEDATEPKRIASVKLIPEAPLSSAAASALIEADTIIIGPGDYYASIMATLMADGLPQVFQQSHARIIYILNLMTRFTQTHEMTAQQHVAGIEHALGKSVDTILINNQEISDETLAFYAKEHEFPVTHDLLSDPRVVLAPLLSDTLFEKSSDDTTHRSLLRHDSEKLRQALSTLITL